MIKRNSAIACTDTTINNMRIILIPILLAAISCNGQVPKHSTGFYFPVATFTTERTYCFVNQNDTTEKSLWKMKAIILKGDTTFQTIIFNNNKPAEKMVEEIHNGNSKILSYTLYSGERSSICTIIDSSVYKINQRKDEAIQWKVTFRDFNSSNTISLTKRRQLQSNNKDTQTYLDKMNMNIAGTSGKYEYFMESIYKRGKGLISYKLTLPTGQVKNFILSDIK